MNNLFRFAMVLLLLSGCSGLGTSGVDMNGNPIDPSNQPIVQSNGGMQPLPPALPDAQSPMQMDNAPAPSAATPVEQPTVAPLASPLPDDGVCFDSCAANSAPQPALAAAQQSRLPKSTSHKATTAQPSHKTECKRVYSRHHAKSRCGSVKKQSRKQERR